MLFLAGQRHPGVMWYCLHTHSSGTGLYTDLLKARRTMGEIEAELREGIIKPDKHPTMRTEQYAAMLDDALRRPGVREAMAVYDACKQALDSLDAYRAATATAPRIITTDHANLGP